MKFWYSFSSSTSPIAAGGAVAQGASPSRSTCDSEGKAIYEFIFSLSQQPIDKIFQRKNILYHLLLLRNKKLLGNCVEQAILYSSGIVLSKYFFIARLNIQVKLRFYNCLPHQSLNFLKTLTFFEN